jgi:hydroxymethylpyrimidine/phosphomethylpyrimidine kinase
LAGGLPLVEAVGRAKSFIHEAIRTNPGLGRGSGPVNHHARLI